MATIPPDGPTVNLIYAAFDEASRRSFQLAMRHSRDGVVRVGDLLAALCALAGDLVRAALPERFVAAVRAPGPASAAPPRTPMANEPALRELLRRAFAIAHQQPPATGRRITPAVLIASAAFHAPVALDRPPEEVFASLGLVCPPAFRYQRQVADPECVPEPNELLDEEDLVDVILDRWLAVRTMPPGPQRERELARIADLAKQLRPAAGATSPTPG